MCSETEFIQHDFKLPDHTSELSKAEDIIEKTRDKVKKLLTTKTLNDKSHTETFEETIRILDYLGRLSMPAFAIEQELEQMYALRYKTSPQLAKKLWLDHYDKIHHPYSILKNRCFRILEELDEEYQKEFKKNPPNWNI